MPEATILKRCSKCNIEKPLDAFYNDRGRPDGKAPRCKACKQAYFASAPYQEARAAYVQTDAYKASLRKFKHSDHGREKIREYDRSETHKAYKRKLRQRAHVKASEKQYRQSDKGREIANKSCAKWRAVHPDIAKAHDAVIIAVRKGLMCRAVESECVFCGQQAEQWHHWNGYEPEHRLDVIPLCVRCHKALHRGEIRNGTQNCLGSPGHI